MEVNSSRKNYVKLEIEIFEGENGIYTKKTNILSKGKLTENFLDELWENDSIDNL